MAVVHGPPATPVVVGDGAELQDVVAAAIRSEAGGHVASPAVGHDAALVAAVALGIAQDLQHALARQVLQGLGLGAGLAEVGRRVPDALDAALLGRGPGHGAGLLDHAPGASQDRIRLLVERELGAAGRVLAHEIDRIAFLLLEAAAGLTGLAIDLLARAGRPDQLASALEVRALGRRRAVVGQCARRRCTVDLAGSRPLALVGELLARLEGLGRGGQGLGARRRCEQTRREDEEALHLTGP